MAEEAFLDIEDLSVAALRFIDDVCGRFEAKWKVGERPRIEEFLRSACGPESSLLLMHLLELEIEYRRRGGEEPAMEDYRERFGRYSRLLESLFLGPSGEAEPETAGARGDGSTTAELPGGVPGVDPDAPLPFSDFALGRLLGKGGMGTVFEARQKSLQKPVAVKVLKGIPTSSSAVKRFLREAKTVARLRHPHIVGVHGIGRTDDGGYFLVMDLIEGTDLEKRIAREPLSFEDAAKLVATIAEAVQHAHEQGIVHRDLKPGNVLLQDGTLPMLTDFGLAKLLHGSSTSLSRTGEILGTPSYMAPEQIDSRFGHIGPGTDVYGLGGILYAAITGRPPYDGTAWPETLARIVGPAPPVQPGNLRSDVPEALSAICMRCLRKRPSTRFMAASEVAAALRGSRVETDLERRSQPTGLLVPGKETEAKIQPRIQKRKLPVHLFVSHSRDVRPFVRRLLRNVDPLLESRFRFVPEIPVWQTPPNVLRGTEEWEKAVSQAVDSSFAALFVVSPASKECPYVRAEIALAKSASLPVFPVWGDGESWSDCAPPELVNAEYFDCRPPWTSSRKTGLTQLNEALRDLTDSMLTGSWLPRGCLAVHLDDMGNTAMARVGDYSSVQALLDDLYIHHLKERYEPFTYASRWILVQTPGRDFRGDLIPRVAAPWSWLLCRDKLEFQAKHEIPRSVAPDAFGLVPGTHWIVQSPSRRRAVGLALQDVSVFPDLHDPKWWKEWRWAFKAVPPASVDLAEFPFHAVVDRFSLAWLFGTTPSVLEGAIVQVRPVKGWGTPGFR